MLLRKTSASHLRDSLYGFKAYEGNSWLLEYDVHHTPVDPDMAAVNTIKHNAAQLKVKHLEMHRAIQMCCFRAASYKSDVLLWKCIVQFRCVFLEMRRTNQRCCSKNVLYSSDVSL